MMIPHKPTLDVEDEDESALELPDDVDGEDDDAGWEPEDDDDLELEDPGEDVGLDADTGIEDVGEGDFGLDEEDSRSWLDDGRLNPGQDPDDPDLDDDEDELSLTEGSEPAESARDDWDGDELEADQGDESIGDSGEEGFDDESPLEELELLPPLDDASAADDTDHEAAALAAELADEPETDVPPSLAVEVTAEALSLHRLPASRVRIETLLRGGRPLGGLIAAGDTGIGWDGSLLVADAGASRSERRFAGAEAAFALAAAQSPDGLLIALATPTGLLCSRDGGRHVVAAARLPGTHPPIACLAITLEANRPRLWVAPPSGSLWVSDDLGARYQLVREDVHVLRLTSYERRVLLVLGRGSDGRALALCSRDDGRSFAEVEIGVDEVERVQDLQVCRDVTLCCRRSPAPQLVWSSREQSWSELGPLAAAPALLVEEDDQVVAYFCAKERERTSLVRRVLDHRGGRPQIVCELETEAGTPLQLAGAHRNGATTIQLGTERAWYRVSVSLDGGPRD
jgi:hypothetical protein